MINPTGGCKAAGDIQGQPPLVLLSGLLCDEEIWADVAEILSAGTRLQIISFANFSSIGAMAEHVLASAPERFAIAGHSMGGRVAVEVMRRAPNRVMGLALLNTGVHSAAAHEAASRGVLVDLARAEGMTALAAKWLPPLLDAHQHPSEPLIQRLTRMVERSTPESFSAQIQALLKRPNAAGTLSTVRVPALLISATGDVWSPPRQHAAMRELCPAAQFTVVDGAGHMSPAEQPAAVASSLSRWLERVKESLVSQQLSAIHKLVIHDACTRQIYKYARLNDAGAWGELSDLFTESGVLFRPAQPDVPIEGRQNILASFEARSARLSRHVVSNVEILIETPRLAHATSSIVLYSAAAAAANGDDTIISTAVGHFHDRLIRIEDAWLFAERRGVIVMRAVSPHPGEMQ